MPISNEEWDAGRTGETLESRILTFLTQNPKPFEITEIMVGVGYVHEDDAKDVWSTLNAIARFWLFQSALNSLVNEGRVEAKNINLPTGGERTYYRAKSL